jgi:hypothetical protein
MIGGSCAGNGLALLCCTRCERVQVLVRDRSASESASTSNRDCWEWEMEVSSRLSNAGVEVIEVRLCLGRKDAEGRSA